MLSSLTQLLVALLALTMTGSTPSRIGPDRDSSAGRGENSSATFVFADLVQSAKAATLVGQVTGGNQRGLNGGQIAWAATA